MKINFSKQQVPELRQLNFNNEPNNEESEQYLRHLCLRIKVIPFKNNKQVRMKNFFELAKVNIPVLVADHAHGIGRVCKV